VTGVTPTPVLPFLLLSQHLFLASAGCSETDGQPKELSPSPRWRLDLPFEASEVATSGSASLVLYSDGQRVLLVGNTGKKTVDLGVSRAQGAFAATVSSWGDVDAAFDLPPPSTPWVFVPAEDRIVTATARGGGLSPEASSTGSVLLTNYAYSGEVVWTMTLPFTSPGSSYIANVELTDLALVPEEHILVLLGTFDANSLDFGSGALAHDPNVNRQKFVAAFDEDGSPSWATADLPDESFAARRDDEGALDIIVNGAPPGLRVYDAAGTLVEAENPPALGWLSISSATEPLSFLGSSTNAQGQEAMVWLDDRLHVTHSFPGETPFAVDVLVFTRDAAYFGGVIDGPTAEGIDPHGQRRLVLLKADGTKGQLDWYRFIGEPGEFDAFGGLAVAGDSIVVAASAHDDPCCEQLEHLALFAFDP
jgi:hypothetical protein